MTLGPVCTSCEQATATRDPFFMTAANVGSGYTGALDGCFVDRQPMSRYPGGYFVVKPAVGTSGGRGVTLYVRSPQECRRASIRASLLSDEVIIERFIRFAKHLPPQGWEPSVLPWRSK
jgi:hypothetical protein